MLENSNVQLDRDVSQPDVHVSWHEVGTQYAGRSETCMHALYASVLASRSPFPSLWISESKARKGKKGYFTRRENETGQTNDPTTLFGLELHAARRTPSHGNFSPFTPLSAPPPSFRMLVELS